MTNHYKSGEANPRTRHSDQIVRRARLIYARGYTKHETHQHLADEGIDVDRYTLSGWLSWNSRAMAGGPMRESA